MAVGKDLDSKYKVDGSDTNLGIMLAHILILLFSSSTSAQHALISYSSGNANKFGDSPLFSTLQLMQKSL